MLDELMARSKALCEKATLDCERADEAQLVAWSSEDTLLAMFAQKELVYRDQQRVIDAMPEAK